MDAAVVRCLALVTLGALGAGCGDSHGPIDAAVDGSPTEDAEVPDAGRSRCHVADGVLAAGTERGDTVPSDCECPEGEIEPLALFNDVDGYFVCSGTPRYMGNACGAEFCDGAYVCVDPLERDPLFPCATAEACLHFVDVTGRGRAPNRCVYADLTSAETGSIPTRPCDTVGEDLCTVNCPCDEGLVCYGLSERHPVGVCTRELRSLVDPAHPVCSERGECLAGETCIVPAERPEWLVTGAWWTEHEIPLVLGRCAEPAACAALQALWPGLWECE